MPKVTIGYFIDKIITTILDSIINHFKVALVLCMIFFVIIFLIIFVGYKSPTYSTWNKIANRVDKVANRILIFLGIIFWGEILIITYVLTQLFKYGGL